MENDCKLSISTIAYLGYEIEDVIRQVKKIGSHYIELSFIETYNSSYNSYYFNSNNALAIRNLLNQYGLECYTLSAHMDLGNNDSQQAFKKRMEFAKEVGASIIITNSSTKDRSKVFFENISNLSKFAEKKGLIIALENPGNGNNNLMESVSECIQLISKINSGSVKINFDFFNILTYSKVHSNFLHELEYIADASVHFHLKNISKQDDLYYFDTINNDIINYSKILEKLYSIKKSKLSLSIELPFRFHLDKSLNIQFRPFMPLMNVDNLNRKLMKSMDFIRKILDIDNK